MNYLVSAVLTDPGDGGSLPEHGHDETPFASFRTISPNGKHLIPMQPRRGLQLGPWRRGKLPKQDADPASIHRLAGARGHPAQKKSTRDIEGRGRGNQRSAGGFGIRCYEVEVLFRLDSRQRFGDGDRTACTATLGWWSCGTPIRHQSRDYSVLCQRTLI